MEKKQAIQKNKSSDIIIGSEFKKIKIQKTVPFKDRTLYLR